MIYIRFLFYSFHHKLTLLHKMGEFLLCHSCYCNCCRCGGLGLLLGCCGFWCCKTFQMEQFDPYCCYCFQESGCGCNTFCLGFVCCHPPWMNFYSRYRFPRLQVNIPITPLAPMRPTANLFINIWKFSPWSKSNLLLITLFNRQRLSFTAFLRQC